MALTHVLTPIKIGRVEIPNRVVRTAHATNLGLGTMSDDLIAYHEARARGGVGLTFIEILSVHRSTPFTLNVFSPGIEDGYRKLVDRVRPHGMRLFQQLWHGGHNTMPLDRSAPWSASNVMSSALGVPPIPMTKAMIDTIVEAFADAARKMEEWGIEGAEVHAAHGYLVAQFLRPSTNRRQDEYGGSFENRARFLLQILVAIRASTSANFALGVRLGADETVGGLDPQDVLKLAHMLEERALIDFVNVSLGNYQNMARMVGAMDEPTGYMLATSTPVSRHVSVPSIVIGKFRTLEEADQVIRSGDAQLVAMTRAHIADPDIVRKTRDGHPERVRPCIACNQGCLGGFAGMSTWDPHPRLGCAVNPGAGRELTQGDDRLVPAANPKNILVIGGGVAGMEAARVSALRGHRVTLAEAQPRLGGTINIAAIAPKRQAIRDIAAWLESEIYRLGVDIRLNTYMTPQDVTAAAPDAAVVATGSTPSMDGVQASNPGEPIRGIEQAHVVSSHDLLTAPKRDWGKTAVVIDDVGHYEAIAAAEHLIARGVAVSFVTRLASFAPMMARIMTVEPALERLSRGDFKLMTFTRAIAVEDGGVIVGPVYKSNTTTRLPADTVVFVSGNRPNREILEGLPATLPRSLVGDANGARFLHAAIAEAHQVAANL